MISSLFRYLWREVFPRWRDLMFSSEFVLALFCSGLMWFCGSDLLFTKIKLSGVISDLITYCAIAFGFSLTGMTLALTLPDREFAIKLASTKLSSKKSAYSDLIFIFSWAAICHLFEIFLCVIGAILIPTDDSVKDLFVTPFLRFLISLSLGLSLYCICRFGITIVTLSQVGSIYIDLLTKMPKSTTHPPIENSSGPERLPSLPSSQPKVSFLQKINIFRCFGW